VFLGLVFCVDGFVCLVAVVPLFGLATSSFGAFSGAFGFMAGAWLTSSTLVDPLGRLLSLNLLKIEQLFRRVDTIKRVRMDETCRMELVFLQFTAGLAKRPLVSFDLTEMMQSI